MSASIVKRGPGRYAVVVEGGRESARRCEKCSKQVWVRDYRGDLCPAQKCDGRLGNATDERRQRWHGPFPTLKEAREMRSTLDERLRTDEYVGPSTLTLRDFLEQRWLPAQTVRASTLDSYRTMLKNHVLPAIGALRLQAVDPARLNALYKDLGCPSELHRALSPKTIRNVHVVLHKALGDAVRWNLLVRNPADSADPPRRTRREMQFWTPEEVGSFLDSNSDHRLHPAFLLAASTGMRRGEVLGLRWADTDLEARKLTITRSLVTVNYELHFTQPKTDRGRRTISLDIATVTALRQQRKRLSEERLALGTGYEENELVFPRHDGRPLHPDLFSQSFDRLVARSGLPRIRLHDLRHSHVAHLIEAGAHVGVISQRIGHASVSFTLDQYGHLMKGLDENAADAVGRRLFGEELGG